MNYSPAEFQTLIESDRGRKLKQAAATASAASAAARSISVESNFDAAVREPSPAITMEPIDNNDFDSVTSSDLDNVSTRTDDNSVKRKKQVNNMSKLTTTTLASNDRSNKAINSSAELNKKSSNEQAKSSTSMSSIISRRGARPGNFTLNRSKSTSVRKIDQRQQQQQSLTPPPFTLQESDKYLKSANVTSVPNLIMQAVDEENNNNNAIDQVDEYLRLQKAKCDSSAPVNPPRFARLNNSHHMSFRNLRSGIKTLATAKSERAISLKSIDDNESDDNEYNEFDPSIEVKGRISLQIGYEKKSSNLSVTIHGCENLSSSEAKKSVFDPYVKIYLLPGSKDKNNKRKTSVRRKTCNPSFDETLRVFFILLMFYMLYSEFCTTRNFDQTNFFFNKSQPKPFKSMN